jgi:hypothetical protein
MLPVEILLYLKVMETICVGSTRQLILGVNSESQFPTFAT